jgi:hypothetical protein
MSIRSWSLRQAKFRSSRIGKPIPQIRGQVLTRLQPGVAHTGDDGQLPCASSGAHHVLRFRSNATRHPQLYTSTVHPAFYDPCFNWPSGRSFCAQEWHRHGNGTRRVGCARFVRRLSQGSKGDSRQSAATATRVSSRSARPRTENGYPGSDCVGGTGSGRGAGMAGENGAFVPIG